MWYHGHSNHGGQGRTRRAAVESLERRLLLTSSLDIMGGELVFQAGSGVTNNLTVSVGGGTYTFSDPADTIVLSARAVELGWGYNGSYAVTGPESSVRSILIDANTNAGTPDAITIESTAAPTEIAPNAWEFSGLETRETVTIGGAGGVQGIRAPVTVRNPYNYTDLTVDNSNDATERTATISPSSITGLAPAQILYEQNDLASLTVKGGLAADTFAVTGTPGSIYIDLPNSTFTGTATTLYGGGGDDTVVVEATSDRAGATLAVDTQGGTADQVVIGRGDTSRVFGSVHVTDGADGGSLSLDVSADGAARNVSITNGTIAGTTATPITFGAGITALSARLSSQADTVNVNVSGATALASLAVDGGAGDDTFNVTPGAVTAMTIDGGDAAPPVAGTDSLHLDVAGLTEAHLSKSGTGSGTWTFPNRQAIAFTGFEVLDPSASIEAPTPEPKAPAAIVDDLVRDGVLSKGQGNALLSKLNLKGNGSDAGRLKAFLKQVDGMLAEGILTPAQAAELRQAANLLLPAGKSGK